MSFAKGGLSRRLTASYARLFTLLLFLLSLAVFFTAYFFLTRRQAESLAFTRDLLIDHVIEELNEGETLFDADMLAEMNTDRDMNLALVDASGRVASRVQNFPFDESAFSAAASGPSLVYAAGTLAMCDEKTIDFGGVRAGALRLTLNMAREQSFLWMLALLLLCANVLGAGAALLLGWRAGKRMLAPIGGMIAEARRIDSRALGARLDVPGGNDELTRLAVTINGMLDRVEAAFQRQGRFTADASHELRTPLAILQGNADLLSRWGRGDARVFEDSVRAMRAQIEYMGKLVENLLFLARADDGAPLARERFFVKALFEEIAGEQARLDGRARLFLQCARGRLSVRGSGHDSPAFARAD